MCSVIFRKLAAMGRKGQAECVVPEVKHILDTADLTPSNQKDALNLAERPLFGRHLSDHGNNQFSVVIPEVLGMVADTS